MNKKGFTLVELLAVIIIIAVISSITTIIVNSIIKNSKNELLERQKNTIEQAAEEYYLKEGMLVDFEDDNSCVNLSVLLEKNYIESSDVINPVTKEAMEGSVIISYSSNHYTYKYNDSKCKIYQNGEIVYFDVLNGIGCSEEEYHEDNSETGYNGIITSTENQNGCLKFYAFNDDGGNTLNLILDHNTTTTVAWNSSGSNKEGPKEVIEQLKSDTDAWTGTITPTNYTMDQTSQSSGASYTVDYSNYKARLITAQEIAEITGNTGWDETSSSSSWYYFDSLTNTASDTCKSGDTSGCSYGWLYDRIYQNCTRYGCLNNSDRRIYGYWTVSSVAHDFRYVWNVDYNGDVESTFVLNSVDNGVRPVITVKKSNLQ